MVKYVIQQFPNLVLAQDVLAALSSGNLNPEYKRKVFEALAYLDCFGLDSTYMGSRTRTKNKQTELVVKINTRTTCVFTIVQDANDTSKFALVHYMYKPAR
ncbi:hypothetical protein D3C73_650950 [compost metagenome]